MEIAIVSDTHSRYQTVETVLGLLRQRGIERVLHCGDIEDADTVWLFEGFDAHFVFGNCDTERASVRQAVHAIGGTISEPYGEVEWESRRIAWIHGDDKRMFHYLERAGHFDFLFYGHTHQAEQHRLGRTLVVNPGALHRARPKTFVVLDLETGELESVTIA
jgi:putative phosphoesterase